VYEDPVTQNKPEGLATIQKILEVDGYYAVAMVTFEGEKEEYRRTVFLT
jgi:hypothetical protein